MDYGKLAYLKADELEAKFGALQNTAKQNISPTLVRKHIAAGDSGLLARRGEGGAAMLVRLRLRSGGGAVYLTVGSLRTDKAPVSAGESECILLGAGGGDIALDFSETTGFESAECDLLLPFGSAENELARRSFSLDGNGDRYAMSLIEDGNAVLRVYNDSYNNLSAVKVGRGSDTDVCAYAGGVCYVYADCFGSMWNVTFDFVSGQMHRNFLGEAVSDFSVTVAGDRLYVFYVSEGRGKYFSSAVRGGSRGEECDIGYAGRVDRLTAVKGAYPLAVVVEEKGKAYLLKEETQVRSDMPLPIKIYGRATDV